MSLITKMSFFENGLQAKIMSTELIIEANVSKKILFEGLDLAKEFESKYSAYRDDSLLCRINQSSGIQPIQCSVEDIDIFKRAYELAKLSNGLFDPTIGILSQGTYGFGKKQSKIPSDNELKRAKKLVDFNKLVIQNGEVYLTKKGMKLDLGGIGKGYIADKIIEFLKKKGATKALVSVGGEIAIFGKPYNIAIKNPFLDKSLGVIKTSKEPLSISTSGNYERYIGSKENHHILDNLSAKPSQYYSSITILQKGVDVTLLDAVATIAFNSVESELIKIAKKFNVAIIAIDLDGEVYVKNFKNLDIQSFEMFCM